MNFLSKYKLSKSAKQRRLALLSGLLGITSLPCVQAAPLFTPLIKNASIDASEARAREAWRSAIVNAAAPEEGCFSATYPEPGWTKTPCAEAPSIVPSVTRSPNPHSMQGASLRGDTEASAKPVGNGYDYFTISSGIISKAVGSFPVVTGLTTESSVGTESFGYLGILGPDEYSLQINSPYGSQTTAACNNHPGCTVWEQFVYSTDYSQYFGEPPGNAALYLAYFLPEYGRPCPTGWWEIGKTDCWTESKGIVLPNIPLSQLSELSFAASATVNGTDVAVLTVGTQAYRISASDSVLDLGTIWNAVEFNIFGDNSGSEAVFNSGTSITANVAITDGTTNAPTCATGLGGTGEGNNLFLGDCAASGGLTPSTQFVESNVGSTLTDTTTSLVSAVNPSLVGQAVGLSAMVTGNSPTGTVAFIGDTSSMLCKAQVELLNNKYQAFCSTADGANALAEGTHSLVATYSGDSANQPSASAAMTQTVSATSAFNPDQFGLSGSWYNPATSGQGMLIAVYPDQIGQGRGQIAGGYFGYTADGARRDWFTLQGEVDTASPSATVTLYTTNGQGVFNAPPSVGAVKVGTATLYFGDCGHLSLDYAFDANGADAAYGKGTIPLQKLDANVSCANGGDTGAGAGTSWGYSGTWYNPATSGQGMFVDLNPSQTLLFAAWYTYAPDGSRDWYTIQTNNFSETSNGAMNIPVFQGTGGQFNLPAPVTATQVGTANMTFTSCTSMTLSYVFTGGSEAGQSGSINQTRLGPTPAQCR